MLALAKDIPEVRAVVTIGAPADAAHVLKNLGGRLEDIERNGVAEVNLAGRTFHIEKQFVDDARSQRMHAAVAALKKPLLILHAPRDEIVGIENATEIFRAAKHPKSFVSLDTADHLLTNPQDAAFAGRVISGWLTRYVAQDQPQGEAPVEHIRIAETGAGKFQNAVRAGRHRLFADEPQAVGGLDSGPSPYDFLSIALGACTSMTLRMYAERKKLGLGRIAVDVSHTNIHVGDCAECTDEERAGNGRIDRFERRISVDGDLPDELREKLREIADKCPVHRTLEASAKVKTVFRTEGHS